MYKYNHDTGRIYDPEDDETIGYLDAQPKAIGLRMAASDDLLVALLSSRDFVKGQCDLYDRGDQTRGNFTLLDEIETAIAKARGES